MCASPLYQPRCVAKALRCTAALTTMSLKPLRMHWCQVGEPCRTSSLVNATMGTGSQPCWLSALQDGKRTDKRSAGGGAGMGQRAAAQAAAAAPSQPACGRVCVAPAEPPRVAHLRMETAALKPSRTGIIRSSSTHTMVERPCCRYCCRPCCPSQASMTSRCSCKKAAERAGRDPLLGERARTCRRAHLALRSPCLHECAALSPDTG